MKKSLLILLLFCLATSRGFALADTILITTSAIGKTYGQNSPIWRFKVGDDILYANPDYNDSLWQKVKVTQFNLKQQQQYGIQPEHKIWFRTHIQLEDSLLYQPLVMQFDGDGLMQVYIDGHLISTMGDTTSQADVRSVKLSKFPVHIPITDTLSHLIAIQYYRDYEDADNLLGFDFNINHEADALSIYRNTLSILFVGMLSLASLFATLFIVHLLLFLFYRKDLSNLYFAIFNISTSTALFSFYYFLSTVKSWIPDSNTSIGLIAGSALIGCFSIVAFVNYLFGKRKILANIIIAICFIAFIIVLTTDNLDSDLGGLAMTGAVLISLLYMIAMFIKAIIQKVPGSRILSFGFLFLTLLTTTIIIAFTINRGSLVFNNPYIALLLILTVVAAILSVPVSITSFLAWRFSNINKSLNKQLITVETLSKEKQQILEKQKDVLEQQVAERTQELQLEKQKSDDLLLNILPQEVAEELKETGKSKAQYFDEVSVLFTDFVNFTATSQHLGVEELLHELNVNFTAFDEIMDRNGLEKIKTIGDAYLAVCGLPAAHPDHALHTVKAALEILDFVEKRKSEVPYGLDIRIGIHSGSVAAGIIGVKKFAYDIWGDTVNTAARMEQNGAAGKINISEATYQLVKHQFNCSYRGKIAAKGKGEIDMYFVR